MPKNTTQEQINTMLRVGQQLPMTLDITKDQNNYSIYNVDEAKGTRIKADSVDIQDDSLIIRFDASNESVLMTTIFYGTIDRNMMKVDGTYEINNNSAVGLHAEGEFLVNMQN